MKKITRSARNSESNGLPWYEIEDLIVGLDLLAPYKLILNRIHRHTNSKTRRAWTSQRILAFESQLSVPTIERAFRLFKKLRIVDVERIRHGDTSKDRHNNIGL